MYTSKVAEDISRAASLACILEVCSYPKPGNISPVADFRDTRFEHFLASSIAIGPVIEKAAKKGILVGLNKISLEELLVGKYIHDCIVESKKWHRGGNTNLGIVTLLVPLVCGAAISKVKNNIIDIATLRQNVGKVMMSTTVKDAIYYYKAIKHIGFAGLGKVKNIGSFNVLSSTAEKQLRDENVSLYQVMKKCSTWDNICKEWQTNMHITFQIGYPTLIKIYSKTKDLNISIVQCYLHILANYADTLIVRKNNYQIAKKISQKAKTALKLGGMLSDKGKKIVKNLNNELRTEDNRLNPGTTADITASSIMIAILKGLRP